MLTGLSPATAAVSCIDILEDDPGAGDGTYWIDPGGPADPMRPFSVVCDMTNGGWVRVDELTEYTFHRYGYVDASYVQPFRYVLTDAQIAAVRSVSSEARQAYECRTVGVGAMYPLRAWGNVDIDFPACWATDNSGFRESSGTHAVFADVPFRFWISGDCGDDTEGCEHDVGAAYFR